MSVIDGNSVILTPAHIQVVIGKDRSCTTMADPATIVLKKTVPADLAKVIPCIWNQNLSYLLLLLQEEDGICIPLT